MRNYFILLLIAILLCSYSVYSVGSLSVIICDESGASISAPS
ncbi:hypothetical protein LCGC14_2508380, partial [marine sediment metagenome]